MCGQKINYGAGGADLRVLFLCPSNGTSRHPWVPCVVTTLASKVGVNLLPEDVVCAARVGRPPGSGASGSVAKPRPIVVRLVRRAVRNDLLRAVRVRRTVTTEGIDLPGKPGRFYVNERLTRANPALFWQAREVGRRLGWRFIWTRDGKIFARQHSEQDAPRHRLRTQADLVKEVGVAHIGGLLGHAMVTVSIAIKKPKYPSRLHSYRPIKSTDMELFNQDLNSLDWGLIPASTRVHEMVGLFEDFMLLLFNHHAPVKIISIKPNKSFPWVTETLKQMMHLRNKALRMYRATKSESDKTSWKDLQVMVETSMDAEKRAFFDHFINSQVQNGKTFWKSHQLKALNTHLRHFADIVV
ncbi:hypothetical protein ACJJTC_017280 [Scirpophaga incertulas]